MSEIVANDITPSAARPHAPFGDALVMTRRGLRVTLRQLDGLLTTLMLPIMLMLLFVYLFGGAIETGTKYVTYVVPGILLFCAGFGSSATAVSVSQDMKVGIIDRFRSLDVSGASVLAGHVAASVLRNIASTLLVLGTALLIGFRSHATPLEWLAAVGMLLLFVVAYSWLAAAVGVLARSPEAANGFTFLMMFLPYPSSMFVPIRTMPDFIQGFATYQPINPVIQTLRGLLLGTPIGGDAWQALAWCVGIMVGSIIVADILFRRRAA